MSNEGTDQLVDNIIDAVDKIWLLDHRDDLKDDCQTFVYENYEVGNGQLGLDIKDLVIAFLSMKCADAMSTADLKSMAFDEETEKEKWHEHLYKLQYEEATQGK